MRLHWHPYSIMPWRVRIALHEKSLAFEAARVDVFTAARTPEFLRLNPFGQIPVLEDGGLVVAESMAILEYLDEAYPDPPLMPAGAAARATVRQLMGWSTDYWPPAWKKWMAPRLGEPSTPETVAEGRASISAHLDVLEPRLARQDWLAGDYSLADICYAPLVLVLDRVDLGDEVARRPNVARWVERLRARDAIQATMMPPAP